MITSFFKRKPILEPATVNWIFDVYSWAMDCFDSNMFHEHTSLVLPNEMFFPISRSNEPEQVAQHLFEAVKKHAGMTDWECDLIAQDENPDVVVAPTVVVQGLEPGPAGTFSVQGERVVISYDPEQIRHPETFIATTAHELAHYLASSTETVPPGGDEFEEYATDALAVYMGFGIFLCNSAFQFNQFTDVDSQGWSTNSLGYLSQYELVYCLAIFSTLKGLSKREATRHLKPSLRGYYSKAVREIQRLHLGKINELKDS